METLNNQNNQTPAPKQLTEMTGAELLSIIKRGDAPQEAYKLLLEKDVPQQWIKTHPLYKMEYLPIDKVELLLDRLFKSWEVEVKDYRVVANSICVHITLKVVDFNGNERRIDGLGAAPLQTKSGASPVDQSALLTDAVMKALPSAKSFAIKDAAEHLGVIFGRNLGRGNTAQPKQNVNAQINNIKNKLTN